MFYSVYYISDFHTISTNVTFGACETRHCVEVTIVNDDELENTESFVVTLERTSNLDRRIILAPANTRVNINDDDGRYFNSPH